MYAYVRVTWEAWGKGADENKENIAGANGIKAIWLFRIDQQYIANEFEHDYELEPWLVGVRREVSLTSQGLALGGTARPCPIRDMTAARAGSLNKVDDHNCRPFASGQGFALKAEVGCVVRCVLLRMGMYRIHRTYNDCPDWEGTGVNVENPPKRARLLTETEETERRMSLMYTYMYLYNACLCGIYSKAAEKGFWAPTTAIIRAAHGARRTAYYSAQGLAREEKNGPGGDIG